LLDTMSPMARQMGAVNWLGFRTLYVREVRRFMKVYTQTLVAPVVTTLLFLAVFLLALGGSDRAAVAGVPFAEFLVPGLIMMGIVQNAFANTSSSIVIAKVQGNIVDTLMPPLSPAEFTLGYALGGVTRGLVVGLVVGLAMWVAVPIQVHAPFFVLFHAVAASLMLSLLGLAGGIWSEKFDHIAAVTNFIVTPLSFLSGTFYSVERLPETWHFVAHFNPFFYMIDGFRYGFIGHADGSLAIGLAVLTLANAGLLWLCHAMVASGYKLKA
jgi:ABC-2 type transport system permease protein